MHQDVTAKLMVAHSSGSKGILSVRRVHSHTIDVDFWLLRGIHCCHHDIGIESLAWIESCLLWDDEGIELVDTDVLHVNIGYQCM